MRRYDWIFEVTAEDLDDLHHVNNVRYVEWIQDISKKHWLSVVGDEVANTMVWVVKKHTIDYKSAAKLGDKINICTYISKTAGPISTRVVEITNNKTGQPVVKAYTEWCLLDASTFRPKRVPENIQKLFDHK